MSSNSTYRISHFVVLGHCTALHRTAPCTRIVQQPFTALHCTMHTDRPTAGHCTAPHHAHGSSNSRSLHCTAPCTRIVQQPVIDWCTCAQTTRTMRTRSIGATDSTLCAFAIDEGLMGGRRMTTTTKRTRMVGGVPTVKRAAPPMPPTTTTTTATTTATTTMMMAMTPTTTMSTTLRRGVQAVLQRE
jgi:hypothetical protein